MLTGVQVDTLNFEVVMSALEAVQISLTIMTSPNMAKQIYKEEVREVCPVIEAFPSRISSNKQRVLTVSAVVSRKLFCGFWSVHFEVTP